MPNAARFYRVGDPVKVEDNPLPRIDPDEILLKIRAASVCHSDVHVVSGVIPVNGPVVLGHEIAGDIEQLGENVENIKKGDRAIVHFVTPCGDCNSCLTGNTNVCKKYQFFTYVWFLCRWGIRSIYEGELQKNSKTPIRSTL